MYKIAECIIGVSKVQKIRQSQQITAPSKARIALECYRLWIPVSMSQHEPFRYSFSSDFRLWT